MSKIVFQEHLEHFIAIKLSINQKTRANLMQLITYQNVMSHTLPSYAIQFRNKYWRKMTKSSVKCGHLIFLSMLRE